LKKGGENEEKNEHRKLKWTHTKVNTTINRTTRVYDVRTVHF
jgi:hypothetical protein